VLFFFRQIVFHPFALQMRWQRAVSAPQAFLAILPMAGAGRRRRIVIVLVLFRGRMFDAGFLSE
jgi:hypothetical protein